MRIFILFLAFSTLSLFAQENNPYKIIEKVEQKYNSLNDYEVEATIKVDVNILKMPLSKTTIFFKKPDKIRLKSKGFALLPKEGLNFLPIKFLENDFTAIFSGTTTLGDDSVKIIKIIPNNDSTDVVLSKLWIDSKNFVIKEIESTTKKRGSYTLSLYYDKQIEFGLPDSVIFAFNVTDIPATNSTSPKEEQSDRHRNRVAFSGPLVGTVTVYYNDYKVNIGLSDEFFEEGKETDKDNN